MVITHRDESYCLQEVNDKSHLSGCLKETCRIRRTIEALKRQLQKTSNDPPRKDWPPLTPRCQVLAKTRFTGFVRIVVSACSFHEQGISNPGRGVRAKKLAA